MSRRGRGEGSISQRRDGRWEVRIQLGYAEDGKRKYRSAAVATQAAAIAKLSQLRAETDAGLPPQDRRLTVAKYVEGWLETVQPRLRRATFARYSGLIRYQIVPAVGRVRLAELQPSDVARMMSAIVESGLSPRTASHARSVLRAALSDAERQGILGRNVAKLASPPHLSAPHPAVLSPEQTAAVVDAMPKGQLRRMVTLSIRTGLRQGELLGLTWDAVDLDGPNPELHVRRALQWQGGVFYLVEPKSDSSRRAVPLDAEGVAALREERKSQMEAQLAAGPRWRPLPGLQSLVFTTTTGGPLQGTSATKRFERALVAAGLPRITWHGLRAAHGALLLQSGVDISVVSKRLGHSGLSVTARHYAGVGPSLQRDAADRLERLLRRPG